jgi:hypothetical protein
MHEHVEVDLIRDGQRPAIPENINEALAELLKVSKDDAPCNDAVVNNLSGFHAMPCTLHFFLPRCTADVA